MPESLIESVAESFFRPIVIARMPPDGIASILFFMMWIRARRIYSLSMRMGGMGAGYGKGDGNMLPVELPCEPIVSRTATQQRHRAFQSPWWKQLKMSLWAILPINPLL